MLPPTENASAAPDDLGYDLLLYGNEQLTRASDNGVLVAFAALAFQQIRGGDPLPHYNVGFAALLLSVFLCAVVHFAVGSSFVGRAKRLIRQQKETTRQGVARRMYTTLAWGAGLAQLICILLGLLLVLVREPPNILQEYLLKHFS